MHVIQRLICHIRPVAKKGKDVIKKIRLVVQINPKKTRAIIVTEIVIMAAVIAPLQI